MSALTIWFCKHGAKSVYVETFSWFTARAVATQELCTNGELAELTEVSASEVDEQHRFVRATMGAGVDGRSSLIVTVVRSAAPVEKSPVEELVTR